MNPAGKVPPLVEAWRVAIIDTLDRNARLLGDREVPLERRIRLVRSDLKRGLSLLRLRPGSVAQLASRLSATVREVRGSLRGARDAEAIAEAFDDLSRRHRDRSGAGQAPDEDWRDRLHGERKLAARLLAEGRIARLMRRLRSSARMLGDLPEPVSDQEIVERFREDYRRTRRRVPVGRHRHDPDRLHRLRQAVIDHRYQLETLLPAANGRVRALERLRKLLGTLQDLEMLDQTLRADSDRAGTADLLRLIRRRQRRLTRRAVALAGRLFEHKAGRLWPIDPALYGKAARARRR